MTYIKFFIATTIPPSKSFLVYARENLGGGGYYFNNVQEMEMIDMCRRLVGAFGTENQYHNFKEINLNQTYRKGKAHEKLQLTFSN